MHLPFSLTPFRVIVDGAMGLLQSAAVNTLVLYRAIHKSVKHVRKLTDATVECRQ